MPSKVFDYEEDGLSYSVTVTQGEDGVFTATVTVHSGHMDVNALYFADDDQSTGGGFGLGGPLNMNGGGSLFEGERIDWDGGVALSRPGLGREGTSKETYLSADSDQNELSIPLPGIQSLDEIDYIGIRATSTSTPEGSIKGVSTGTEPDPEVPEDPDCDLPDGTNKVLFAFAFTEEEDAYWAILDSDLEGIENPTLQDYYDALAAELSGSEGLYSLDNLIRIEAFNVDKDGVPTLLGTYELDDDFDFADPVLPEVCFDLESDESVDDDSAHTHDMVA
ncbi:MAG: hypothetical protein JJU15_13090 [Pararhodobacter sp.]|nr:hypothetical protein [Pararhodobacter sp.]